MGNITILDRPDDPKKDKSANSRFRVIYELGDDLTSDVHILFGPTRGGEVLNLTLSPEEGGMLQTNYTVVDEFGEYEMALEIDGALRQLGKAHLLQGGVYNIVVCNDTSEFTAKQFTLTTPNSIHIMWLFPQYLVITIGEIMFSVTGLEFSYSQAPGSMKSVLQAAWLLTVAFGNIIVIIVAEAKAFNDQASEFFMFACLMLVDTGIFMWLAWRY